MVNMSEVEFDVEGGFDCKSNDSEPVKSAVHEGRRFTVVKERCEKGFKTVREKANKGFDAGRTVVIAGFRSISEIIKSCDALATALRMASYAIMGLKECGADVLKAFHGRSAVVVNLIDTIMILSDIEYFATGQYKKDHPLKVAGCVALAVADTLGVLMFIDELSHVFSNALSAIGNTRIMDFVSRIPVGGIVSGIVGVGFFFIGADALRTLYTTRNVSDADDKNINITRIKASLDLLRCGLEVTGKVIVVAAAFSIIPGVAPGVIVLIATFGVAAGVVGLASFLFGTFYEDELKASKETRKSMAMAPGLAAA